jgi:5-methylcytosine-specific restriction endonuclease McrA
MQRLDAIPEDSEQLRKLLSRLRVRRKKGIKRRRKKRLPRKSLGLRDRASVLEKTGGRCHICGGVLDGDDWHADHVFHYASGGARSLDNYLPTHALCNSYRRCFSDAEFQWILRLGVWLRNQIEKDKPVVREAAEKFCLHQKQLRRRRGSI